MKRRKRVLAVLLAAVMCVSAVITGERLEPRANTSALASSYNTNVNYIAYATDVED